jgi:hypothetical protein
VAALDLRILFSGSHIPIISNLMPPQLENVRIKQERAPDKTGMGFMPELTRIAKCIISSSPQFCDTFLLCFIDEKTRTPK